MRELTFYLQYRQDLFLEIWMKQPEHGWSESFLVLKSSTNLVHNLQWMAILGLWSEINRTPIIIQYDKPGVNPAISKGGLISGQKGVPTKCPHSNALIVQKIGRGVFQPLEPTLWIRHCKLIRLLLIPSCERTWACGYI